MSEFDEEAEREKIRKQFEQDKQKRESTERMSELLLQGATMTDTHCEACGDPLFRYEGQQFCPSCQVRTDDQQPEDTQQSAAEAQQSAADAQQSPDTQPATAETTASTQIEIEDETTATEDSPEPTTESTDSPASADTPSDLSAARQSLASTITRFAKHAETTEDPDRARAFLAATEDAATALDALNQATQ